MATQDNEQRNTRCEIEAIGKAARKAPEKIRIAVVACPQCGAPIHPDAARAAFSCPYCDHVMPYSEHALAGMRPLAYKHREVPVEGGLLKHVRVAVLTGVADDLRDSTDPGEAHVRWARSFADYVAAIDRRAYVTRRDRFEFTFVCPHCASPVPGSSTQTMYACGSRGSVFGLNDMATMGLDLALLDRMQPWDFNEAGVFLPDLVVGDVFICAATNYRTSWA